MDERLQTDTRELEIPIPSDAAPTEEIANYPATGLEKPYNDLSEEIHINITDDVDDEAFYGRNRRRHKSRGK